MFLPEHSFTFTATSDSEFTKALQFIDSIGGNLRYNLIIADPHRIKLQVSYDRNHKTLEQWLTDLPDLLKQFVYDGKDFEGNFIGTSDQDEEEGFQISLNSNTLSDQYILIAPAYWICGQ